MLVGRLRLYCGRVGSLCVLSGTVPITVIEGDDSTPPTHAAFKGTILFKNTFGGKLPAADYPKVNVGILWLISLVHVLNISYPFSSFISS